MKSFDFQTPIDRRGTDSIKFDFYPQYGIPEDAIPLWVADMDFHSPPEVMDALRKIADFGVFGYTYSSDRYFRTVCDWFRKFHDWSPPPESIVQTPGVMFSVSTAIRTLTQPGETVLIQQPVYYPFMTAVRRNDRRLSVNYLQNDGKGYYSIDFDDFERKIVDDSVRLFLLCSPHNPVGRVWREEELRRMGEICFRYGVPVVSDEIHADLVFPGNHHCVFPSLGEDFARNCVLCSSPTKTFNLPGIHASNTFIPNPEIRSRFSKELHRFFYYGNDLVALRVAEAAYGNGRDWLDALLSQLRENIDRTVRGIASLPVMTPALRRTIQEETRIAKGTSSLKTEAEKSGANRKDGRKDLSGPDRNPSNNFDSRNNDGNDPPFSFTGRIIVRPPEGTYLLWLDCRGLGLTNDELTYFFAHRARLWPHWGPVFGPSGSGFVRINIATSPQTIETALSRLKGAFSF